MKCNSWTSFGQVQTKHGLKDCHRSNRFTCCGSILSSVHMGQGLPNSISEPVRNNTYKGDQNTQAKITEANSFPNPSILFQQNQCNSTNACSENLSYKVHKVGATRDRKITETGSLPSKTSLLAERQLLA